MSTQMAYINDETLLLATKIARKYELPGKYELDDLKQICSLSLMKAAETYDPSKGCKFATYACRIMQNDLNSYLYRQKNRIEKEVHTDRLENIGSYCIDENVENSLVIQRIKEIITEEEFKVLWMYHVEGIPQNEIADEIGSRQPQVCRILKRAKAKVKLAMGDEYGTFN